MRSSTLLSILLLLACGGAPPPPPTPPEPPPVRTVALSELIPEGTEGSLTLASDGTVRCEQTHEVAPAASSPECAMADGFAVRARVVHVWIPGEGETHVLNAPIEVARVRACGAERAPMRRVPPAILRRLAPDLAGAPVVESTPHNMACREGVSIETSSGVEAARDGSVLRFTGASGHVRVLAGSSEIGRYELGRVSVADPCNEGAQVQVPTSVDLELVCEGESLLLAGGRWHAPPPGSCEAGQRTAEGAGPGAPCVASAVRSGHVFVEFARVLRRAEGEPQPVELAAPELATSDRPQR